MSVLVRAISYAILFISFVLVLLPARLLSAAGVVPPGEFGVMQAAGMALVLGGGGLALWCVWTFATVGHGTPAPFDPPRRLVVRGPYAVVRNPMYLGAGLALVGASLFYRSLAMLGYAVAFFLATHLFVVLYEESALRGAFGADYASYRRRVGRWWPRMHGSRTRDAVEADRAWMAATLAREWGSPVVVSRGRLHRADRLPGLVAERAGRRVGLLTYRLADGEMEVVTVQALEPRTGVGSALLAAARRVAAAAGCRRLWLVTTNDNTGAQSFYASSGMELAAVHRGAIAESRRLKPEIPLVGHGGCPIEDELEYQIRLGE